MGGPWQVQHVPVQGVCSDAVANAAFKALRLVDNQMSNYRGDSDLMRLNAAPIGAYVPVPAHMITVMICAQQLAEITNGALNIALGRAVNRWGFGPDPVPTELPSSDVSMQDIAQSAMGCFDLRTDPPAVLKKAEVSFDLCALAKGYAVDLAARAIASLGVENFLIEAAGEVYAKGEISPNKPWSVGLELPVPGNERLIFDEIALNGMAVATSGGHRNQRQISGQTVSHTIDPRTCTPLQSPILSVTVMHNQCMNADALATCLYVLGPEQGPKFAAEHDIAALFLIREPHGLKEIRSEAFVAANTVNKAPI